MVKLTLNQMKRKQVLYYHLASKLLCFEKYQLQIYIKV
jgi:hypothetical protein